MTAAETTRTNLDLNRMALSSYLSENGQSIIITPIFARSQEGKFRWALRVAGLNFGGVDQKLLILLQWDMAGQSVSSG
jgi:hypothetical protein